MSDPIPVIRSRRETTRNRFFTGIEEDLVTAAGDYTYCSVACQYDAVVVIPVLDDGRLVVERIYRHPYRAFMHEFPAGGIEKGENPLTAAARELEEETGYRARQFTLLQAFAALPGLMTMHLSLVLATGLTHDGTTHLETLELLEVLTLSETEAWTLADRQPASAFLTLGLLALQRQRRADR